MPGGFVSPFGNITGPSLNPSLSATPQGQQLKAAQASQQNQAQKAALPTEEPQGAGALSDLGALVLPQIFSRTATAVPNQSFVQRTLPAGANTLQAPVILPEQLQQLQQLEAPQLPAARSPYIYA